MTEVYESQRQTKQQFEQIVGMLMGGARLGESSQPVTHPAPVVVLNKGIFPNSVFFPKLTFPSSRRNILEPGFAGATDISWFAVLLMDKRWSGLLLPQRSPRCLVSKMASQERRPTMGGVCRNCVTDSAKRIEKISSKNLTNWAKWILFWSPRRSSNTSEPWWLQITLPSRTVISSPASSTVWSQSYGPWHDFLSHDPSTRPLDRPPLQSIMKMTRSSYFLDKNGIQKEWQWYSSEGREGGRGQVAVTKHNSKDGEAKRVASCYKCRDHYFLGDRCKPKMPP